MISWFRAKGLLYFVRLFLMTVLTGFNFALAVNRWGLSDADPLIKASALIVAGTTEIGLFAFLILFHQAFYPQRRWAAMSGWALAALACMGVSLYVNIGYFAVNWHDANGNAIADLLIRAVFPMGLLLFFSMIPPKLLQVRSAEEIDRKYDSLIHEEQRKQELEAVHAQKQDNRRQRLAGEQAEQAHLRILAGVILHEHQTTDEDDNIVTDWIGLKADLRARGLLSEQQNGLATLPTNQQLIATAKASESSADDAQDEDDERSNSGNHRTFISAAEVATILDVTVKVARDLIKSKSTHKYAIKGCKNIRLRRSVGGRATERRAPYAEVLKIQQRMVADRDEKVRPFPRPQDEQERA